ncbi:RluA family pseudouridine synthase [Fructilactobacillus sp. Tb1]|uniref:RluA family pseudouridine synthase n=1 Tax=Fructilactobacillus sp. Tb1 TaxID=3422304 RepID=UPI003D2BBD76
MINFNWVNENESRLKLRTFLLNKGVTRTLLKRIKFHGGRTLVNGEDVYTNHMLEKGDQVEIMLPPEEQNEVLNVSHLPIDILFENDNYLIINKPVNVATVPSHIYPNDTMVNRVLGYYIKQDYPSKTIHVVNRLDRGTSGPVIFAKNALAHAILDKEFKNHRIKKSYIAGLVGRIPYQHASIILPIGRKPDSFLERMVIDGGKYCDTEFWKYKTSANFSLVKIRLHTGRTHQIRVHFSTIGYPLIGDWLYGQETDELDHQALHSYELAFWDALDDMTIKVTAPIPNYFNDLIKK